MFGLRDESGLGIGALSKSWRVRAATVLAVGTAGVVVGIVAGHPLEGLLAGIFFGITGVVMGESSMDTGAYKYPEKYI